MKDMTKSVGGKARAEALTPERRTEIAKKAAAKQWDMSIPQASHQGILSIAGKNIDCVVTETGERILSVKNVFETFGRTQRGYRRLDKGIIMPPFMDALNLVPFISDELYELIEPIEYRDLKGKISKGYRADILPQICLTYLKANTAGVITKNQAKMVDASHVLIAAFSTVGIIALVDEATGYQQDRLKDGLNRILEAYISKALQPYISTIPADYYKELFRLRNFEYDEKTIHKTPSYYGHIMNNIIYARLAPGVLEELKRTTPRNEKGRLKYRYFQKLTANTGYVKLKEHIASVVSIMKLSNDYQDFIQKLDRIHPVCLIEKLNDEIPCA